MKRKAGHWSQKREGSDSGCSSNRTDLSVKVMLLRKRRIFFRGLQGGSGGKKGLQPGGEQQTLNDIKEAKILAIGKRNPVAAGRKISEKVKSGRKPSWGGTRVKGRRAQSIRKNVSGARKFNERHTLVREKVLKKKTLQRDLGGSLLANKTPRR